MEKINPQYYTFDEFLQGRLFEIPDYQRAYSWTAKQRKDLFQDVLNLFSYDDYEENERTHFMATVVCCNKKKKEKHGTELFEVYDIVDGQQRITTLIILLKAILKKLKELDNRSFRKDINRFEELLVKDNDNRLILIQTNHDSSLVLRNYLLSGIIIDKKRINTLAESNLYNAFKDCENFVNKWCETKSISDLIILVKYRICFVFHELQNESTVYTVFEVLNSRGLDVDWIDKCKSILMGICYEAFLDNEPKLNNTLTYLRNYWSMIYKTMGIKEIPSSEILRFAATLYHPTVQSKVLKPEEAIEYFREIALQSPDLVVDISKWIFDVASELSEIYGNNKLNAVTDIIQSRLLRVAINLSEHFDENDRELLFQQWERMTFRIYGLYQKDSRTKVGEYVRLSQKIMAINDNRKYIHADGRLKEIYGDMMNISREFPASGITKRLEDANCYGGWEEELRYLMYSYERYICSEAGYTFPKAFWEQIWESSASESIEHIYPQNESDAWKGKIPRRKEYHANRLGNLMILPLGVNKRLRNFGFEIKKKEYSSSPMFSVKEISEHKDWNINTIEDRTKKILEWAQKEWDDIKLS